MEISVSAQKQQWIRQSEANYSGYLLCELLRPSLSTAAIRLFVFKWANIKLKYITVNFDAATSMYVNYLESIAMDAENVPTSIYIGTCRLAIELDHMTGNLMSFETVVGVVGDPFAESTRVKLRVSGFCLSSVSIDVVPQYIDLSTLSLAEEVLSKMFNDYELDIVRWVKLFAETIKN